MIKLILTYEPLAEIKKIIFKIKIVLLIDEKPLLWYISVVQSSQKTTEPEKQLYEKIITDLV